jgi:hypothetical protein
LSRAQRADRLAHALYFGQRRVVQKLLDDDPTLAPERCDLRFRRGTGPDCANPSSATEPLAGRSPILHLADSKFIHMAPDKRTSILQIAALLVEHGADVNDGCQPEPDSCPPPSKRTLGEKIK